MPAHPPIPNGNRRVSVRARQGRCALILTVLILLAIGAAAHAKGTSTYPPRSTAHAKDICSPGGIEWLAVGRFGLTAGNGPAEIAEAVSANPHAKAWVEQYRKLHCEKIEKLEKWLIAKHENAVHNRVPTTGTGPTQNDEDKEIADICLPGVGKALKMHLIKGRREIELWHLACAKTLGSFDRPYGGWDEISVKDTLAGEAYTKIVEEHHITGRTDCGIIVDEEGHVDMSHVPDWALKQGVEATRHAVCDHDHHKVYFYSVAHEAESPYDKIITEHHVTSPTNCTVSIDVDRGVFEASGVPDWALKQAPGIDAKDAIWEYAVCDHNRHRVYFLPKAKDRKD
jgi:hypothetical protein